MYFVYILKCNDGTFYTGYTVDLEKRLAKHNQGKASKYTRGRLPVEIVYTERFDSKSQAMQREASIKKLKRPEKIRLIKNHPY